MPIVRPQIGYARILRRPLCQDHRRRILHEGEGYLVVEIFDNSLSEYIGATYGRRPIDLSGDGGIRFVGVGPLVLNGDSDFNAGIIVEAGELTAEPGDGCEAKGR